METEEKYAPYTIYGGTQDLDPAALEQFLSAMALPFVEKGALMADAHLGYSVPIGTVAATKDVVVPSWVGFDIGCGVEALKTKIPLFDVVENRDAIFDRIYEVIPTGFSKNEKPLDLPDTLPAKKSEMLKSIFMDEAPHQLGTLGGGNHFIEIGFDVEDSIWILVHSGSRHLGHTVASHYMAKASGSDKARDGHYGLFVESELGRDYLVDMEYCAAFAKANRNVIIARVLTVLEEFTGIKPEDAVSFFQVSCSHNNIIKDDGLYVHRKGAVYAPLNRFCVIPINMRDGAWIVVGRGNPDSLQSCSHGAGRKMSRNKAKKELSLEEFQSGMSSITAKIGNGTLDESPGAYKDMNTVIQAQAELISEGKQIFPLINIKA